MRNITVLGTTTYAPFMISPFCLSRNCIWSHIPVDNESCHSFKDWENFSFYLMCKRKRKQNKNMAPVLIIVLHWNRTNREHVCACACVCMCMRFMELCHQNDDIADPCLQPATKCIRHLSMNKNCSLKNWDSSRFHLRKFSNTVQQKKRRKSVILLVIVTSPKLTVLLLLLLSGFSRVRLCVTP